MLELSETTPWCVRTTGSGGLRVVPDREDPLGPSEVLVAVRALGLNFRDLYFIRGDADTTPALDRVPFSDAAGKVVEVGPGVDRFAVGDRVLTTVLPLWEDGPLDAAAFAMSPATRRHDGFFRRRFRADQRHLVRAPHTLTDAQAATLPVAALTAWHAVAEAGEVGASSTVVVQTTGGVATFATQFAAALGARTIVTSRSDGKLALARELGATDLVNTVEHPDWDEIVLAATDGRGADLVVDMGLDDGLRRSARAAAFEGMVAVVGIVQTRTTALDIMPVMNKNLRVRGVETGSQAMFERMNRFIEEYGIEPVIDSVFPAADAEAALDRLASSPFGKVVLEVP